MKNLRMLVRAAHRLQAPSHSLRPAALRFVILSFTSALLLFCSSVLSFASGVIDLPQTGQTKCYDSGIGGVIDCANTGQDGEWQAGVPWPKPRFVSGTGTEADCIIDKLTGLMWPKNVDHDFFAKWQDALDRANDLNLCGHTDWRVPNVIELRSLINDEEPYSSEWLSAQGFNDVWCHFYHTSTTYAAVTSRYWYVHMCYGVIDHYYKSWTEPLLWPVRAGQSGLGTSAVDLPRTGQTTSYYAGDDGAVQAGVAWPSPRFSESGECVTDNLTGLMWTKDANRFGSQTWQSALNSANELNLCGFTDWRLPNVNELRSVVDYSYYYVPPAQPYSPPFINVQPSFYWSSTSCVRNIGSAWYVNMGTSVVGHRSKDYSYNVWPVRGGQFGDLIISPSDLMAKATSSSKIVLSWKDNSDNETGFKIERKKGNCGSANFWAELPAAIDANSVSYTNSGLTANTTYSYRIRTYHASRESAYSNCASAMTALAGTPNAPTNLKATSSSSAKVTLAWTGNATNETRFEIYRKAGAGSFGLLTTIESADVKSYADTTATGNDSTTAYAYYVRACNATGCSPATSSAAVPFRPTAPKATPSTGKIDFTWKERSTDENGFQVYRKDGVCSSANTWSMIYTTTANVQAYSNTGVTSGSSYSYRVRPFTQSVALPYATGYSMYTGCVSAVVP